MQPGRQPGTETGGIVLSNIHEASAASKMNYSTLFGLGRPVQPHFSQSLQSWPGNRSRSTPCNLQHTQPIQRRRRKDQGIERGRKGRRGGVEGMCTPISQLHSLFMELTVELVGCNGSYSHNMKHIRRFVMLGLTVLVYKQCNQNGPQNMQQKQL